MFKYERGPYFLFNQVLTPKVRQSPKVRKYKSESPKVRNYKSESPMVKFLFFNSSYPSFPIACSLKLDLTLKNLKMLLDCDRVDFRDCDCYRIFFSEETTPGMVENTFAMGTFPIFLRKAGLFPLMGNCIIAELDDQKEEVDFSVDFSEHGMPFVKRVVYNSIDNVLEEYVPTYRKSEFERLF